VIYECLYKASPVLPERIELQNRLKRALADQQVTPYKIDVEDLQDLEILRNRKNLSLGELTVKTNALQRQQTPAEYQSLSPRLNLGDPTEPLTPGRVESPILFVSQTGGEHMRMYTEEEVAAMLRVSLSQLRKWRIKRNKGRVDGPPFRKVGRLVRYPERALQAYVDGE
jgi:hypothetical protein